MNIASALAKRQHHHLALRATLCLYNNAERHGEQTLYFFDDDSVLTVIDEVWTAFPGKTEALAAIGL